MIKGKEVFIINNNIDKINNNNNNKEKQKMTK